MGVILHVMLSGRPPFESESADLDSMYDLVLHADIPSHVERGFNSLPETWGRISDSAKGLVLRLLARDPARRPSSAECRDGIEKWRRRAAAAEASSAALARTSSGRPLHATVHTLSVYNAQRGGQVRASNM